MDPDSDYRPDRPDNLLEIRDRKSETNLNQPNAARMYDYFLGGGANFKIDRDAAERILEVLPGNTYYVQNNRAFLGKAVRYLVQEAGVDQFLDLGSGVPTVGNVHEIAHRYNPNATVAYVDFEPIAVNHAQNILDPDDHRVTVAQEDIRNPDDVLNSPGIANLFDFHRPIAVLAIGILPFLYGDDEVKELLTRYRDATVSGSYLAISHIAALSCSTEVLDASLKVLSETPTPERSRNLEELTNALPDGYSWIEPGIVPTVEWRPERNVTEEEVQASNCYAALGYKL